LHISASVTGEEVYKKGDDEELSFVTPEVLNNVSRMDVALGTLQRMSPYGHDRIWRQSSWFCVLLKVMECRSRLL